MELCHFRFSVCYIHYRTIEQKLDFPQKMVQDIIAMLPRIVHRFLLLTKRTGRYSFGLIHIEFKLLQLQSKSRIDLSK